MVCVLQVISLALGLAGALKLNCAFTQVVIFVKSVARAKELNKLLVECNFPSICIHSAQKQEERCAVLVSSYYCLRVMMLFHPAGSGDAVAGPTGKMHVLRL